MTTPITTPVRPELAFVNPAEILIDTNVRTIVDVDPAFYESIRDYGVRTPPTCWRDEDGVVHVECGQRRVLAATQAKLPEIPVLIVSREQAAAESDAERSRIVSQLLENEQRAQLEDVDRVQAYEQLTLFGMSADEIAKATKTRRDRVRAAVKLTKDEAGRTLLQERQLTIDEALVMNEFAYETTEILDQLERTLREAPRDVPQLVLKLRVARERDEALAAAMAEADALGVPWRDSEKLKTWDGTHQRLELTRIGKSKTAPTIDEAKAQGGLVASLYEQSSWDGKQHNRTYSTAFYIEHPGKHGYNGASLAPEKTEKQIEAERVERQEKKARKAAWIEATELRHAWIKSLIASLKFPDGAEAWIVRAFAGDSETYGYVSAGSSNKPFKLLLQWIDPDGEVPDAHFNPEEHYAQHLIREATPRRTVMYGLGYALARAEITLADPKHPAFADQHQAAPYLQQIAAWGHTIHPSEQRLMDIHAERTSNSR